MGAGGLGIGAAIEWVSVHLLERWTYGPQMPVVPGIALGVVPLLQMILLPLLIFWLAALWSRPRSSSGPIMSGSDRFSVWLLAAVSLGLPLFVADRDRRPLDDPNLVFQRPGFLDPHGPPFAAPRLAGGLPDHGHRAVVFFIRPAQSAELRLALSRQRVLLGAAHVVIVAGGGSVPRFPADSWIADSSGRIAGLFRMRRPRDGGPPVGYAIVDSSGLVRYATLDPGVAERLKEVQTMLAATP